MAFELPALPSFQTNIPQMPSALDQYGKMLQLKSLQGQQAMQPLLQQQAQQDIQAKTLENQQRELELKSTQSMMKAVASGDLNKYVGKSDVADGSGFDAAGAYQHLVASGVLPQQATQWVGGFQTINKNDSEIRKNLGAAQKDFIENRDKAHDQLVKDFSGVQALPPDQQATALQKLQRSYLGNQNLRSVLDRDDLALLNSATPDHIDAIVGQMGLLQRQKEYNADQVKKAAEAAKAGQGVIPASGGLSPDTQQQVQKDVAVATNPQIQQGKEAVAAAEGQARANVEAAVARGGQAALAKVPTHLVAPATEGAIKAGTEYAQAKSVSDRLQAMMDAAKNGNVVSYQLIPEEGALQVTTSQGVHRINMAEIQNYGGGSLWQRLEGHIGKALTGQSIPDSVLKDMTEMQKIQAEGSRTKYENTLKTINQATGADFKPVEMETMKAPSNKAPATPPAGATHIGVSSLDKKKYYLDANGKKLGLAE